ncbi:hypothetical protein BAXH7_02308 [Bacillus amyloliquefaciens XH7]|nr:hypothetical protein BAXH7_02308 [Bacillus amyloliquefaciens XH7]
MVITIEYIYDKSTKESEKRELNMDMNHTYYHYCWYCDY